MITIHFETLSKKMSKKCELTEKRWYNKSVAKLSLSGVTGKITRQKAT